MTGANFSFATFCKVMQSYAKLIKREVRGDVIIDESGVIWLDDCTPSLQSCVIIRRENNGI